MPILTREILNTITGLLYTGASVAFYSVTPTGGETLLVTLNDGFTFVRQSQIGSESAVKMWLAADSGITVAQIKIGGVVVLTANGVTTRYKISSLLPQQQLGAGYVLRLAPQKGAAG